MNYEQRKELKRRIDETVRNRIAGSPNPSLINYRKAPNNKGALRKKRWRDNQQQQKLNEAGYTRKDDNDICLECGRQTSKFTPEKYKHEDTCSKRD